jgi:toxin ParE1/3/4
VRQRKVIVSPEAREDLLTLYDWIAEAAGGQTAINYIARIEATCRSLDIASERGSLRNDIRPGLRIIGFERRVTIAFDVNGDVVTILRVFYGGRNWEPLLR